ncbi:MAG: MAPEG family protein [Enterobacterales bacterium]|nr:MAPEG family protein [Enterobacterales bacterium]
MTDTLLALVYYIAWILALLSILGGLRTYLTLVGKKAVNSFSPAGSDVSEFSGRLCRAHANCYEFFPIAGGLLLIALATGQTAITDPLALYFVIARILQSVTHLLSTSVIAVFIRFGFFLVQIVICVKWVIDLIS